MQFVRGKERNQNLRLVFDRRPAGEGHVSASANLFLLGPTTTSTTKRYPASEPELIPLPMVTTATELLLSTNKSVPSIWRRNQFGGLQGR